jgi:uncharacterized membrane protein YgcG
MKKYISLLVTLVVTLFAMNALAFNPPPAPARGGYVVDQTGKLSDSQIQQLNRKIDQVSKATKNEFGILFLRDMGGENIEDVANTTFKSWGVGKHGLDNGCLIVVSLKEHKSRIETGKGVEGDVPDLKAHDILVNNLNPHLKRGDFYGGFDDTLNALDSLIESRHNQKAEPRPVPAPVATTPAQSSTQTAPRSGGCSMAPVHGSTDNSGGGFWTILMLFGGIGLFGWYLARQARRRAEAQAQAELEQERLRQRRLVAAEFAAAADERRRQDRERQEREEKAERARVSSIPTPPVFVPEVPVSRVPSTRPAVPRPAPRPVMKAQTIRPAAVPLATAAAVPLAAAAAVALAAEEAREEAHKARLRREREAREAREAQEASDRRRRADEEEDQRRRQREEDDRRSSSSSTSYSGYSSDSSSSSDYSSGGSSGGGFDSGGGFGGGDSGGGGSSSDW